ncbi:hypothetical protein TorRG33x02_283200 [Trema orientale]|uniref:Uncharacterized protein n=1 Tax=Trema orientale TaxID=63057 RepID=A0A2P5CIY7_TREOI|nr:hypothetical protein TorRG33x02_283200 [Trema orientale]
MDLEIEHQGIKVDRVLGWGRSLTVHSVQEMVRNDSEFVPERYIQENENRPLNSAFCSELSEIPVVEFLVAGQRR